MYLYKKWQIKKSYILSTIPIKNNLEYKIYLDNDILSYNFNDIKDTFYRQPLININSNNIHSIWLNEKLYNFKLAQNLPNNIQIIWQN